mmetsp:Transcript_31427/g.69016  ORF Transcript_31427/g.69016 Transcript_31427/m.69016 type:complete len:91 (+) Transcript_31427:340-612(+)
MRLCGGYWCDTSTAALVPPLPAGDRHTARYEKMGVDEIISWSSACGCAGDRLCLLAACYLGQQVFTAAKQGQKTVAGCSLFATTHFLLSR